MSKATAYQLLMRKRPELFTDKSGRGPITASMKIFKKLGLKLGERPCSGTASLRVTAEYQVEPPAGLRRKPQRSTEGRPRTEEKQPERINQDHGKSDKEKSKEPKKEEPK
jgi:hypothetical protein